MKYIFMSDFLVVRLLIPHVHFDSDYYEDSTMQQFTPKKVPFNENVYNVALALIPITKTNPL